MIRGTLDLLILIVLAGEMHGYAVSEVARIRPMQTVVDDALGSERFVTMLLGLFAGVALLLAVVGFYGVVSHGVSQRGPHAP